MSVGISKTSVYLQSNTVQAAQAQTSLCYAGVVSCHIECGFVPCCGNFHADYIVLPPDSPGGKKLLKNIGLGRALSAVVSVPAPSVFQHFQPYNKALKG